MIRSGSITGGAEARPLAVFLGSLIRFKSSRFDPCRAAMRRAAQARLAHGRRPACMHEMNVLIAEARRMALSKGRSPASKGTCVVYILRLRSGTIYIGASEDLEQRLDDHASGQGCRTTQLDPPITLLLVEEFPTFSGARTREAQLKRWSREKKEALIKGKFERLRAPSQSREKVNC